MNIYQEIVSMKFTFILDKMGYTIGNTSEHWVNCKRAIAGASGSILDRIHAKE